VPSTLLFIPFSRLVALLGLQNQLWALVLIYPTFTVPFCTWLLMGFFRTLPKEVEESALVDGCSRFGAITRVVLPLAVPGLLTVVIFALTLTIQEFVYSLTFISSVERMTVSVGVPVALVRGDVYYWGSLMAACLITSVPLAVLYNFFLDRFIAGFHRRRDQVAPESLDGIENLTVRGPSPRISLTPPVTNPSQR
jgi:multiple sugar transport system permease protein